MSDHVFACVTRDPIPYDLVAHAIAASGTGAHVLFSAVVRADCKDGRRVVAISYDAHPAAAERTLGALGEEARTRWGEDLRVAIVHRTGRVQVGEACLVIGVSAAHREEAYEASREILEAFKTRSPFRKQEHHADASVDAARSPRAGVAV